MIKVITTTTIFPPSESLLKFAAMEDWILVIAGDLKTPISFESDLKYQLDDDCERNNIVYLSPKDQEKLDVKLSDAIGWNCIQRRNFAFLYAYIVLGAEIFSSVDDDNIPYPNWGKEIFAGQFVECDEWQTNEPAFDPLTPTVHSRLWHRGYPIELVRDRYKQVLTLQTKMLKCDVQANLWDGEADVDAICRLSYETSECRFRQTERPYTSNKPSPFNSQNTILSREAMPHYFMFPGVGRMDDIFASYHVQAQGYRVMYGGPTVVQKRNEHNVLVDMQNELIGLHNNLAIVKEIPTNKNAVLDRLPPRSVEAFRLYQKHFE